MRGIFWIFLLLGVGAGAHASEALDTALLNVHQNCAGISSELADMKKMAGINTVVTGVGTVAGGAATAVGIAKSSLDAELNTLEQLPRLQIPDEQKFKQDLMAYAQDLKNIVDQSMDQGTEQSKKLGNWRTGLLATNTVTNIAGASISGANRINGDLQTQIDACVASVDNLNRVLGQERLSETGSNGDITRAQKIVTECGMWGTVNLRSVNNRARGATVASGVGAGVGLAGTIVSAMANSKSVRNGDDKKEQNLNTTANVMAGGATVASATATIFNATQISAIKRAADVADRCEEALQ